MNILESIISPRVITGASWNPMNAAHKSFSSTSVKDLIYLERMFTKHCPQSEMYFIHTTDSGFNRDIYK